MRAAPLRLLGVSALVAVALAPRAGFSWGDEGHSITALIAQQLLADQAKAGDAAADKALKSVQEILGSMKIDQAATWPDEVKNQSRNCDGKQSKYGAEEMVYVKDPKWGKAPNQGKSSAVCDAYKFTSGWHFINTNESEYVFNPKSRDFFKGDMVMLIRGLAHGLKGEAPAPLVGVDSFIKWKQACMAKKDHPCKREALSYLIHLLGDIHQPLHSGSPCDLGGNVQYVVFFGQPKDPGAWWCTPDRDPSCNNHELHQAWDANLLVHAPGKGREFTGNADYAAKLVATMKSVVPGKCVTNPIEAPIDVDGDSSVSGPVGWVKESLCYVEQAYTFPDDPSFAAAQGKSKRAVATENSLKNRCRKDKLIGDENAFNHAYGAFEIGEKYYQANIATINERLYWGGFRLASLLKSIYGSGDQAKDFDSKLF